MGGFVAVDINCLGPGKNLAIALALLARNGTFETPRKRPIAAQASATAVMTRLPGAWHQLNLWSDDCCRQFSATAGGVTARAWCACLSATSCCGW
jgi:hypothetical protein